MEQSEKNKVFLKLMYESQILIKVLEDAVKKSTLERTKIERDEQMKCFGTSYEPKVRSNIYLIGILERENRENNGKEVIFKRRQEIKKKKTKNIK